MMARWHRSLFVIAGLALSGCHSVYFPQEIWGHGYDPAVYTTVAALDNAIARDQTKFRPDLLDCVSRFDPAYLDAVKAGEPYRLTGWFVPAKRFRPGGVRACMVDKGWAMNPYYDKQKFDFDEHDETFSVTPIATLTVKPSAAADIAPKPPPTSSSPTRPNHPPTRNAHSATPRTTKSPPRSTSPRCRQQHRSCTTAK
jgi:hypothetical protein